MGAATQQQAEALVVKSEIHLEPRPGDNLIDAVKLRQFDLFRRMKKGVSIERFPGSIILRRYRKGDVVFQQGQAGGTAFYVPTAEDLARLKALEEGREPPENPIVDPQRERHILSALIIPATKKPRSPGLFERWFGSSKKSLANRAKLTAIPNDGPSDVDFQTREAPLNEGNLFGEMSCISFMPRSATVVARVDCWLLEFNRNVFDQVRGDKNHQKFLDDEYRRRTLDTHLRQFQIFQDLSEAQIQLLKDNASLIDVAPGSVICEEGEKWSDSNPLDVFIVRNGVVQVIVNANLSVRKNDIRDWASLCQLIVVSEPDRKLDSLMPKSTKGDGPSTGVTSKPLSPLEKMRQQKEGAGKPADSSAPPASEKKAEAVPSKPSPMDLIRAKQAAALAEKTGQTASVLTNRPADETPAANVPTAKLSPLEQIRAKQAAAAAKAASETAPAAESAATPPAEAVPKLSPLEQIRAKQAAAAAKAASETAPAAESAATPPAEAAPKLSPLEQIRAKQAAQTKNQTASAATDAPGVAPEKKPVVSSSTGTSKPSPLELMRSKQIAKSPAGADGGSAAASSVQKSSEADLAASSMKELPLIRKPASPPSGPPIFVIKSWLSDHVLQAIRQIGQGELTDGALDTAKGLVIDALNELTQAREFLADNRIVSEIYSKPELLRKTGSFPKGFKGIAKDWSELELRTAGRAALSEIFPNLIRRPVESSGPPRVLAYLSRGECVGEMAVVRKSERSATCIAYNHPSSENPRDFGNVELVKIPGSVFRKLMTESPQLEQRVITLTEKRAGQVTSTDDRSIDPDLIASTEFQQMGLFQGSKLLVIDLDSCTRCGDCVQACVDTHDDGVSRLFLDGPRYDRFLVPSACRNCLNPVCMLGCPVGSIGRGDNGQIEIFDWCIGCSACADQCPYDSIQMHDMGLIPEESSGWLYANRRSLQNDWYRARRLGSGWMRGESPFRWQGDFLRQWSEGDASAQPLHLCFRHEFRLPKKSRTRRYRISINDPRRKGAIEKIRVKTTKVVGVWLNGEMLEWSGNSIELPVEKFSSRENVLAIEVALEFPAEYRQFILSACLDAIPELGTQGLEVIGKDVHSEMDLVTRKAAVCDMCSHIPSQQPACVNSCPHDAAIRVNPMLNFPM